MKLKIYKIKDFIRKTESGRIDLEGSKKIVRELAEAAGCYADNNILVDLRGTTTDLDSMRYILEVANEMVSYKSVFRNKIANVVPGDEKRLSIANKFKACLDISGFQYEVFTDFEDAIEWLSDVKD